MVVVPSLIYRIIKVSRRGFKGETSGRLAFRTTSHFGCQSRHEWVAYTKDGMDRLPNHIQSQPREEKIFMISQSYPFHGEVIINY